MDICKNCNSEVSQNYCPNCGHPTHIKRIDGRYLVHEIGQVLNFEKGFIYTIKVLTIHPGSCMKSFLNEDRSKLVKPIVFLIISSLIYSLINNAIQFEAAYINLPERNELATVAIFKWVQANYGYANIIMAFFIGIWMHIFFKKYPFNFYEILVVLCFVMGMGMLIYAAFGLIQGLTQIKLMQIAVTLGFLYSTFAIGHFYNHKKWSSYVKALIAYLLGMITFLLVAFSIGIIMDLTKGKMG